MPAKKSKKKNRRRPRTKSPHKQPANPPAESRPVESATIAWMLSCLIGLTAEFVASILLFAEWMFRNQTNSKSENSIVLLIAILAIFVAIFLSPINLILAGILKRIRKEPPPNAVLYFAIAIGLTPIPLVLIARTLT